MALLHELCRKHGQGGKFVMSPCACCKAIKTLKLVAWLWGWCCAWRDSHTAMSSSACFDTWGLHGAPASSVCVRAHTL